MLRQFQSFSEATSEFFSLCHQYGIKTLPKNQQQLLYITLVMTSEYLCILPGAMIWLFNSWEYLFYLNYIVYLEHTWTGNMKESISLFDHLVLVSSCVFVTHVLMCPLTKDCTSYKIRYVFKKKKVTVS